MLEKEWEIEIAYYTNHRGFDPDKAWTLAIMRWMYLGDLRPLAAAIAEGRPLAPAVLNLMHDMILDKRLVVQSHHGRPRKPELAARTIVAGLMYQPDTKNSEAEFDRIADALGTSHQTIRQAITAFRNRAK